MCGEMLLQQNTLTEGKQVNLDKSRIQPSTNIITIEHRKIVLSSRGHYGSISDSLHSYNYYYNTIQSFL